MTFKRTVSILAMTLLFLSTCVRADDDDEKKREKSRKMAAEVLNGTRI